MREEEKRNFIRKKALIRKDERNIKENIITNQALKTKDFLEKSLIIMSETATAKVRQIEK